MREIIETWAGGDLELLAELNQKQFKKVIGTGLVTLPMVAAVDQTLAASLNYTLEQIIDSLRVSNPAQASFLDKFLKRLAESSYGVDLANDALRANLAAMLQGAGWPAEQIDQVLSIGAVLESHAQRAIGREAVQADVDAVRATIARERLQADYQSAFAAHIQGPLQTGTRAEVAAAMRLAADGIEGN